jgi:hypothetical protein
MLIHNFHSQSSATFGSQVVVNEVLVFEVALANAAGVVLAKRAAIVPTTRTPASCIMKHPVHLQLSQCTAEAAPSQQQT